MYSENYKDSVNMNPVDNINFIQSILDFLKIEHRDVVIINFIVLSGIVIYSARRIYNWNQKCENVDCESAKFAIKKAATIEKKVEQLENLLIEIKVESGTSHGQLRRDLDRFDRYLEDLQRSTFELHGILLGSASDSKNRTKRRIIHDED